MFSLDVGIVDKTMISMQDSFFGRAVGDGVTSDQNVLVAKFAWAYANKRKIWFPDANFKSTATIPHFHEVVKEGPGRVTRGGATFYITPGENDPIELFTSVAGVTDGDGLAGASPLAAQYCIETIMPLYGPVLQGIWTIDLAAGTYDSFVIPSGLRSMNRWNLLGPNQGAARTAPTAIITRGARAKDIGIAGNDFMMINIEDIQTTGFSTSLQVGIQFGRYSNATMYNIRSNSNWYGLHFLDFAFYQVFGSVIDSCTNGVLELFHVVRGNNTDTSAERNIISNCTIGCKSKEHDTGHWDWCEFDGNAIGIFFTRSCTANISNCIFKNHTLCAVVLRHGSFCGGQGTVTWQNNVRNWATLTGSTFVTNEEGLESPLAPQNYPVNGMTELLSGSYVPDPVLTITAMGTGIQTICILGETQPGSFTLEGGYYHMRAFVKKVGTAGIGTFAMRFDTADLITVAVPATFTGGPIDLWYFCRAKAKQTGYAHTDGVGVGAEVVNVSTGTTTFEDTTARPVKLMFTPASAADAWSFYAVQLHTTEILKAQS